MHLFSLIKASLNKPAQVRFGQRLTPCLRICKVGLIEVFLFGLQVLLLIDIQVSYINTNHEDFIGFAK